MSENNPHFLAMTANTIGEKILAGLVQEIRILPDSWHKLSENKQADVIARLEAQVTNAVTLATHMIAGAERKTAYGKLESVAIKDKMKAVLVINQSSPCRHELLDAVEQDCLIILGGADEFMGNIGGAVQPDPDQTPLDLNGGDHDMQEPGAWGDGAIDGEFQIGVEKFAGLTFGEVCRSVAIHFMTLDAGRLQSRFAVSSDEATRLILLMLAEGVIELEEEGETPLENQYKVIKQLTDIDLDLE